MLKKVFFEGFFMADFESVKPNIFEIEDCIRVYLENESPDTVVSSIKKLSDIPDAWRDSIPYGDRKDDKTCTEIFNEEILPKLELEDKNQLKFSFWEQTKSSI